METNKVVVPEYVKQLGPSIENKWTVAYSAGLPYGEGPALFAANQILNSPTVQEQIMARTERVVETLTVTIDTTEQIISRTDDGEEMISFKLADVFEDSKGVQIPEHILQAWADAINAGKTLLGDVDHNYLNDLALQGLSMEEIKAKMATKPGIAKTVKAVFEKGRLWVQAVLDKRYRKVIEKSKGVSLEAHIKRDSQGKVFEGSLLGFTFGVKKDPVIPGTEISMH